MYFLLSTWAKFPAAGLLACATILKPDHLLFPESPRKRLPSPLYECGQQDGQCPFPLANLSFWEHFVNPVVLCSERAWVVVKKSLVHTIPCVSQGIEPFWGLPKKWMHLCSGSVRALGRCHDGLVLGVKESAACNTVVFMFIAQPTLYQALWIFTLSVQILPH